MLSWACDLCGLIIDKPTGRDTPTTTLKIKAHTKFLIKEDSFNAFQTKMWYYDLDKFSARSVLRSEEFSHSERK